MLFFPPSVTSHCNNLFRLVLFNSSVFSHMPVYVFSHFCISAHQAPQEKRLNSPCTSSPRGTDGKRYRVSTIASVAVKQRLSYFPPTLTELEVLKGCEETVDEEKSNTIAVRIHFFFFFFTLLLSHRRATSHAYCCCYHDTSNNA